MPTISAYTSDSLARQVAEVSKREGRKVAQISAEAIDLYVALGEAGRRAFIDLSTKASLETRARAVNQAVRVLIKANIDRMEDEFSQAHPELTERFSSMTDEELDEFAVKVTSDRPVSR